MTDNESETHILDVAISYLQNAMWIQTGNPPRDMHQLVAWSQHYFLTDVDELTQMFRERASGLFESMQDVDGDFFDALWKRIQARTTQE